MENFRLPAKGGGYYGNPGDPFFWHPGPYFHKDDRTPVKICTKCDKQTCHKSGLCRICRGKTKKICKCGKVNYSKSGMCWKCKFKDRVEKATKCEDCGGNVYSGKDKCILCEGKKVCPKCGKKKNIMKKEGMCLKCIMKANQKICGVCGKVTHNKKGICLICE